MRRREILARQPSYCKILNDLKEVESSESEEQELAGEATETKQEKPEVGRQFPVPSYCVKSPEFS